MHLKPELNADHQAILRFCVWQMSTTSLQVLTFDGGGLAPKRQDQIAAMLQMSFATFKRRLGELVSMGYLYIRQNRYSFIPKDQLEKHNVNNPNQGRIVRAKPASVFVSKKLLLIGNRVEYVAAFFRNALEKLKDIIMPGVPAAERLKKQRHQRRLARNKQLNKERNTPQRPPSTAPSENPHSCQTRINTADLVYEHSKTQRHKSPADIMAELSAMLSRDPPDP